MIQKIKEMSFGTAKYIVLKELDERGPIGQLLISYDYNFANNMMNICEWIDRADISVEEKNLNSIQWSYLDEACCLLSQMSEKFPFLMLISSELEWTPFVSAWLTIADQLILLANYALENGLEGPDREFCMRLIDTLQMVLAPIHQLIELSVGYQELLKASAEIVKELRGWKQSQPAAIRLSRAYLQSMGVVPPDEGPDNRLNNYHEEPMMQEEAPSNQEPCSQDENSFPPPPPVHDEYHPNIYIGG